MEEEEWVVRVDFNTFCETKCNNQYTNSVHWVYRGVLIMAENGYSVMSFHVCVHACVCIRACVRVCMCGV